MKLIRKEYPRVYGYVNHGKTYFRVDLRRKGLIGPKTKNFKSREDALAYARAIGDKVNLHGIHAIAQSDPMLKTWQLQCAVFNHTFRHTFCTYQYAQPKDKGGKSLEVLRSIMGNTIGIAERFYKGTMPQADTEAYWQLTPKAVLESN